MVHLSAVFLAVLGSSLVSALNVPVEARADSDAAVDQTAGYNWPVNFVKGVNVHYKKYSQLRKGGIVTIDADINLSPVPVEVTLDSFSALGTRNGVTYLSASNFTFAQAPVFHAFATKNTGAIKQVKVVNDLQAIIDGGKLIDLTNGVVKARAGTIGGSGGVPVRLTLNQKDIPIKFIRDVD